MDWKRWYRAEAESAAGRAAVARAIENVPEGDAEVRRALREGGAVSFPHTTLLASAEPLARVAASVLSEPFERVVALGVVHGSALPEPERRLFAAAARGDADALASVGGAFAMRADVATPFGRVPAGPAPRPGAWLRAGGDRWEEEFSLDLFLAVLAAAAAARAVPPPPVTRILVGVTAREGGGGEVAEAVARGLGPLLGPRTALVATGDLVHAGHGYAPEAEVAALPDEGEPMRTHFVSRVNAMFEAALGAETRAASADAIAREIRSDQRHVLPVLRAILGAGARASLLSFRLTDYGGILAHPSPCVVATALVTLVRGGHAP